MTSSIWQRAGCALALGLMVTLAGPAGAADDTVVARVGAVAITEDDIAFAMADFAGELERVPEDQRRKVVIDVLVDIHLLASAAREKGLGKTDEFSRRVEFLTVRALRNAYVQSEIAGSVTDAELAAEYKKQTASFEPEEQVRARHILVVTKQEAEAIIRELDGGADFAELATQKSTGPSGPNGGDLGQFGKGQMVPEFESVAFTLEAGAYTAEPVETQFRSRA
ncbi:MAG: peptidylprolyl isomerase [Alphaproteobacteria bacterium]